MKAASRMRMQRLPRKSILATRAEELDPRLSILRDRACVKMASPPRFTIRLSGRTFLLPIRGANDNVARNNDPSSSLMN